MKKRSEYNRTTTFGKSSPLFFNTVTSFGLQLIAILSSFIVPRCILSTFGSATNGTVTSITAFLGFISLLEAGVGGVAKATLYKPVAEKDYVVTSMAVNETRRYFNTITLIYVLFVAAFSFTFPAFADNGESFLYNFALVVAIAVTNLLQYYFGAGYMQVLHADQKLYILNLVQTAAYALNIVLVFILTSVKASIHMVKLVSSIVFLIRPAFVRLYVNKHYPLQKKIFSPVPLLKQKWNNLAQTIAYFIHSKTDVVVLTLFLPPSTVSVYSIYAIISTGLSSIVSSFCSSFTANIGTLYWTKKNSELKKAFRQYEFLIFNITVLLFVTAWLVSEDFVRIYTSGINDADYIKPAFSVLILAAESVYCLRMPYNNTVLSAGHFKETQNAALIEVAINILLSVALVKPFELVGVAIGTLCAMLYRTTYLVFYLSKRIVKESVDSFFKQILVYVAVAVLSKLGFSLFEYVFPAYNYFSWILKSLAAITLVAIIDLALNYIFFRSDLCNCCRAVTKKLGRSEHEKS